VNAQVLLQLLVDLDLTFGGEQCTLLFQLGFLSFLFEFLTLDLPKLVEALVGDCVALLTHIVFALDLLQGHVLFFEQLGLLVAFQALYLQLFSLHHQFFFQVGRQT